MFEYLKLGSVVKHGAGIRKTIVRIESGKVIGSTPTEMAGDGTMVSNKGSSTHFVLPQMTMPQEQRSIGQ